VAIALAILVPWGRAEAVRVERRGGPGSVGIVRRPETAAPAPRLREPAGAGRVDVQLERTRRMLGLVLHRAERCASPDALEAVRGAIELQDRAESAARAGRRLGALQLTREARARGVAALRHCGHTGRVPDGVVSALGRTDELLDVERERLSGAPSAAPDARAGALERAAESQRRARAEFRDGRLESSLRLTQEARRSLRSAARDGAPAWHDAARSAAPASETVREAPRREASPPPATRPRPRRD
jgi:hypothetical protein